MANINFKQIKAIEQKNKEKVLKTCPYVTEESGIYILTREENGFKYAYIGQAKHLLTRLASHLRGYQHIDLSLRKHGFYAKENPTGWEISCLTFTENELDKAEQRLISEYANAGFQLRNKTAGGQGQGKVAIYAIRPARGYYDGLKQGYTNAQRFVAKLFQENLSYDCRAEIPTKNQQKAMLKFEEFIKEAKDET